MKIFLYTCLIGLMAGFAANAQSKYDTGMEKAFELWEQQKPIEAANLFERIANAEKEEWLPYYYAAQLKIIESFSMTDRSKKEQQIDEAQDLLDQAASFAGENNVEVAILQAMLHTSRLTMDPSIYGMKLSPVINSIYEKALKEAPGNPRVVLSKAEWDMGSARFFGENPAKYCDDLKLSVELFDKEHPEGKYAPSWGKDRAQMLIANNCGSKE